MDNGFILPYRARTARSYGGTRQGKPGGAEPSNPRQGPFGGRARVWGAVGDHRDRAERPGRREKPRERGTRATVPQTDTGGQVEYTEVSGIPLVKELGKMAP